eukprot:4993227-Pleurochrysis_carterae.AAC.1
MSAVYVALASLHCNKRMAVAVTRKGKVGMIGSGGKRTVGLIENLRPCVNQRRSDADLRNLFAADAENRMLLRWDSIPCT